MVRPNEPVLFRKRESNERRAYELTRRLRRQQFKAEQAGNEVLLYLVRGEVTDRMARALFMTDFEQVLP